MPVNSDHMSGFVVGLGAAALGYYLYKRNQATIDDWLRQQGIDIPTTPGPDYRGMSVEELMTLKEHLDDILAEREFEGAPVPDARDCRDPQGGARVAQEAREAAPASPAPAHA